MSIDINRLRELAKIALEGNELSAMEKDMESIVALMDTLKDAEIPSKESSSETVTIYELRADEIQNSLPVSLLVEQSPAEGEYSIPRVVDGGGSA